MGVQLFANNASSQLSGSLPQGGTTLVCATGQGARFPSPSNGDFFYVTLYTKDAYAVEQNIEIVKVTSRATDVMTIVRDIEGITGNAGGFAYAGGSDTTYIDMRWTAGCVGNMAQKSELATVATTGSYADLIDEPTSFSPSVITQDSSNRFVTDAEKSTWNAKEAAVAAGTTAQYYRGDKSFQTLDKAAVGLGNVTNTADVDKPVSTAQATAIGLKLDATHSGLGGTAHANAVAGGAAGFLSGADKTKLDGLVSNANHTGEVTGSTELTVTNAAVIGKVLTGYVSGAGTLAATDTILQAFNKLNGNVAAKGVGDVTLTGAQTLTNKTLTGYTETQYSLTGTDIAVSNGTIQYKTLSGNTTFTESLADGQGVILMLNPATFTTTWPTTTWIGTVASTAPTLIASVFNCLVFFQMNGTLYGRYVGRV